MSSDSVNIRFKELIEQDNIICSEQDIEEYIGWFRTIGLPIQNYIIKELEEQYGQELTLFREKVDEFNMTLTQLEQEDTTDK